MDMIWDILWIYLMGYTGDIVVCIYIYIYVGYNGIKDYKKRSLPLFNGILIRSTHFVIM